MKSNRRTFTGSSFGLIFLSWASLLSGSHAAHAVTPWWAPIEQTKPALFSALEEKFGKVAVPKYPSNEVLKWSYAQFSDSDPDPKDNDLLREEIRRRNGRAIYEHLLVAEDILQKSKALIDPAARAQQHRRIIQLAGMAALYTEVRLKDPALAAQIRETYQLPYLDSAPSDGQNMISKEQIVGSIASGYNRTQQEAKEIAALKALIEVATTRNSSDSARLRLAQIYARKEDYARAIAYLEAIRDPSMLAGANNLLPKYQALQAKQNQ